MSEEFISNLILRYNTHDLNNSGKILIRTDNRITAESPYKIDLTKSPELSKDEITSIELTEIEQKPDVNEHKFRMLKNLIRDHYQCFSSIFNLIGSLDWSKYNPNLIACNPIELAVIKCNFVIERSHKLASEWLKVECREKHSKPVTNIIKINNFYKFTQDSYYKYELDNGVYIWNIGDEWWPYIYVIESKKADIFFPESPAGKLAKYIDGFDKTTKLKFINFNGKWSPKMPDFCCGPHQCLHFGLQKRHSLYLSKHEIFNYISKNFLNLLQVNITIRDPLLTKFHGIPSLDLIPECYTKEIKHGIEWAIRGLTIIESKKYHPKKYINPGSMGTVVNFDKEKLTTSSKGSIETHIRHNSNIFTDRISIFKETYPIDIGITAGTRSLSNISGGYLLKISKILDFDDMEWPDGSFFEQKMKIIGEIVATNATIGESVIDNRPDLSTLALWAASQRSEAIRTIQLYGNTNPDDKIYHLYTNKRKIIGENNNGGRTTRSRCVTNQALKIRAKEANLMWVTDNNGNKSLCYATKRLINKPSYVPDSEHNVAEIMFKLNNNPNIWNTTKAPWNRLVRDLNDSGYTGWTIYSLQWLIWSFWSNKL